MLAAIEALPDLFYTGYTQDTLKELTEAHLVYAFVNGGDLPTPQSLGVPSHTFLNGMSEAGTEMRRFALDMIRRGLVAEAEPFLSIMDEVYSQNITIDFPDAITGGLRRQTDVLRGTLERTARRRDHGHAPGADASGVGGVRRAGDGHHRHAGGSGYGSPRNGR